MKTDQEIINDLGIPDDEVNAIRDHLRKITRGQNMGDELFNDILILLLSVHAEKIKVKE